MAEMRCTADVFCEQCPGSAYYELGLMLDGSIRAVSSRDGCWDLRKRRRSLGLATRKGGIHCESEKIEFASPRHAGVGRGWGERGRGRGVWPLGGGGGGVELGARTFRRAGRVRRHVITLPGVSESRIWVAGAQAG